MKKRVVLALAKIAIFASLSTVLYFIRIPLTFLFPSFLEIQFSNLPAVIGGFLTGPVYGVLIVIIRTLITLPFSTTQCVGELADLLIGVMVVFSSSLVYRKFKTKKGGLLSLLVSIIVWVLMSVVTNRFITLHYYMKLFEMSEEMVVEMLDAALLSKFFGEITTTNYMKIYIFSCVIPFNLIVSLVVSLITLVVYKRVSNAFHNLDNRVYEKENK